MSPEKVCIKTIRLSFTTLNDCFSQVHLQVVLTRLISCVQTNVLTVAQGVSLVICDALRWTMSFCTTRAWFDRLCKRNMEVCYDDVTMLHLGCMHCGLLVLPSAERPLRTGVMQNKAHQLTLTCVCLETFQ